MLKSRHAKIRRAIGSILFVSGIFVPSFLNLGMGVQAFAQATLDVEPGLTIPNAKTPWAIDIFEGKRELVPIHHSVANLNKHTGSNIAGSLAGSFFYKPKMTTELDGLNSRNHLHTRTPVIYVLLEEDKDPAAEGKSSSMYDFVIAPVEPVKGKRVVDRLAFTQLTGHAKREKSVVETVITQVKDGWLRIEPKDPLPEGEYVLLPVPKINGTYSPIVWDFGINLKSPNTSDAIEQKL